MPLNEGIKVNKKRFFFLFLIVLVLSIITLFFITLISAQPWIEYGGNFNGSHHVPNVSNTGFDWTNINLSFGQDQEITVENFVGDSLMEALIWNTSSSGLFLINLTQGSVIRKYNINATLWGEPTVFKNKYYAIVKNNVDSNSYFYEISFNETNHNVSFNFSFGNSEFGRQSGVRCATTNGTDYCLFMDMNNTIYRVDVSNKTYNTFKNDSLKPISLQVMKKVPALADLHQDGGLDAVFTYLTNTSNAAIFVYDITANAPNNGFSGDGQEELPLGAQNVSPAFIHRYNNLDNRLDITFTVETNNPHLFVYDANGSQLSDIRTSNNRDFTTVPVLSRCDFFGRPELPQGPELGIQFFTGDLTGPPENSYEMRWISSILNGSSVAAENVAITGGTLDSFVRSVQSMVAADFNGDGLSELLFTLNRYSNGVTNSIVNCSNSTHILHNLTGIDSSGARYHNVVVDFNNDGLNDIISTTNDKTLIFKSNATTTDLEILEVIPIQVVRDVDMVKDKLGIVRVVIRNNGFLNATATVNATLDGSLLNIYPGDTTTKLINVSKNETFDFSFKPTQTGTQTIRAEVKVE